MDWTNLIVGSAIGFLLSIIANIYTDKYKDWAARRTIQTKNMRVSQIKNDLERFAEYKKTPTKFYFFVVRRLFSTLFRIQVFIFLTFVLLSFPIVNSTDSFMNQLIPFWFVLPTSLVVYMQMTLLGMIILLLATSYYSIDSIIKDINAFVDFEDFKKAANKRIEQLS